MKKTFTILLLGLAAALPMVAQIPNESPIPVEVSISTADGFFRQFDYSSTVAWADTLTQTVTGDLVWAYSDSMGIATDSLVCDSAKTIDLTGKMALIRRGECNFSLKAWNAQQAGAIGVIIVNHTYNIDGGGLVNMAGGINADLVTIPTVFLTRDDGDIILDKLDNGVPVTASFTVRPFGGPRVVYSYHTPKTGVIPLEDIAVTFVNTNADQTISSLSVNATITDPTGTPTTLTQVLTDVAPLSVNNVQFDQSYLPGAVGDYTVVFSNSETADVLESKFVITDYTYAQDNDVIIPNTNGTIEPSDDNFVNLYGFRYDFGNFYRTGDQAQVGTHATFMISNPAEIYTGVPSQDVFHVNLYDADPDGSGTVPYPTTGASYDILDESGGTVTPIASADYVLNGTEQPFDFLHVEFDPINLEPNKIYLLMVEYNGEAAGVGIPPKYAFGGTATPAGDLGSAIFIDNFRTEGWPGFNALVRLQLEGFSPSSTTEKLDDSKIAISPNPVKSVLKLELSLDNNADQVDVSIFDFMGRQVRFEQLENVKDDAFQFDVSTLPTGTYFMSVTTPEGFRSKKFQVMR